MRYSTLGLWSRVLIQGQLHERKARLSTTALKAVGLTLARRTKLTLGHAGHPFHLQSKRTTIPYRSLHHAYAKPASGARFCLALLCPRYSPDCNTRREVFASTAPSKIDIQSAHDFTQRRRDGRPRYPQFGARR